MADHLTFALARIGFAITLVLVLTLLLTQYAYIVYRAWRMEAEERPSPSLWRVARRAAWIYGIMDANRDFGRVFGEPTSLVEGRSAHSWFSFCRRSFQIALCATLVLVIMHICASTPPGRR
jgi:hypothetical protein